MSKVLAKLFYTGGRPGFNHRSPVTGVLYRFVGPAIPAKITEKADVDYYSDKAGFEVKKIELTAAEKKAAAKAAKEAEEAAKKAEAEAEADKAAQEQAEASASKEKEASIKEEE